MVAAHLSWSKEEVRRLRELRADGVGNNEVSVILKRPVGSVADKVRKLGLPPLPILSPSQRRKLPPRPSHEPLPRAGKTTLPPLPSLQSDERC